MKYWRGYLVAIVFAAISLALVAFAKAHTELVDMIYPYMTRIIISSLADWSGGVTFCLWTAIILVLVVGLLVSIVLMFMLRWNFVQWLGWVLAVVCGFSLCSTLLYGLNDYTGPLAEDIRLEVTEYTVSELSEAAAYFRDQANAYAGEIPRDKRDRPEFDKFAKLAKQAGEGFEVLTYDEAISVFAGSTAPVKKLSFLSTADSTTMPLTGEAAVNPSLPSLTLPFVMCKEMARRMSIADEGDSLFAAFLACKANSSQQFQYSGYCLAYYYCYSALPEQEAQKVHADADALLKKDVELCQKAFGKDPSSDEKGTDVVDLLASWYIQEFITPLHKEEEKPFDPLDSSQVDLTYVVPEATPLPKKDG